jgi:hypothetical protein
MQIEPITKELSRVTAAAPLWLAAIGITVLLIFALAAGALLLCRYDQRHDRDVDFDVTLGRRSLRYRSRPQREHATAVTSSSSGGTHSVSPRHHTQADDVPAAPGDIPPAAERPVRRQAA